MCHSWQLDKVRKWTQAAKNLLFQIHQGSFDLVCVTLPAHGMSRALFANSSGPTPLRSRIYPYGFPWAHCTKQSNHLPQRLLVHAFATNLHRALLFAAKRTWESRAPGGNSSELQLMSRLGAHREAFYTCEIAKKWCGTQLNKAGSMGVLSSFHLPPVSCAGVWPRLNEARKCVGPVRAKCSCGTQHTSQRASSPAIHATVCAEFLTALHRLSKELGEPNSSFKGAGQRSVLPSPGRRQSCTFLVVGAAMAASDATLDLRASRTKKS